MSIARSMPVYLVDGVRTPFLRARGVPGPFQAADMAAAAMRALLRRQQAAEEIGAVLDEVVLGCVQPRLQEVNIARIAARRAGIARQVPAVTVNRVCGSGMQAIDVAACNIAAGRAQLVLAGGVESMSHAPLALNAGMQGFLTRLNRARNWRERLRVLSTFRPSWLKTVSAVQCALSDSELPMRMGDTAEVLVRKFSISREEQDAYALHSHQRAAHAWEEGVFDDEVVALSDAKGRRYERDDGIRADTSMQKLQRLKPVFDPGGTVTAGNSSQITDGAAVLLLAGEEALRRYDLEPLAELRMSAWAGLRPEEMGLGPAYAIARLLQRGAPSLAEVDCFEINEAFAAQVLACVQALADETFCREELGLPEAAGDITPQRLNVHGGAIALGHPLGASGARIVLHLARVLQQRNAKRGIAALCIGGGQGGAMLLER